MRRMHRYDAIVVGAGPAGSTAAIRLAQAGWSVALVERDSFPRRKVCGECIAASNWPLLDALGVGEQFAALAGPPLRRVALLCGRDSISAPLPPAQGVREPWGRALGREQLDMLLLARARRLGVTVWQPYAAHSLSGGPGDYRCVLHRARVHGRLSADGETALTLEAPVAIAANGSWQRLPGERAPGQGVAGGRDLLAFKANFIGSQIEAGVLPVLAFAGGYGGMVIADRGMITLACCIQRSALQRVRRAYGPVRAGEGVQAYLQEQCQGVAAALTGARRTGEWLAIGPIRPGLTLPSAGAAPAPFHIGNAAGEVHPLVGEGISMALQSAWLLCALLIECPAARAQGCAAIEAHRTLHARYNGQWRRQFIARMRLAACLAQVAMRPAAMRALLPLLRRAPMLLTHAARGSGKISALQLSPQEISS